MDKFIIGMCAGWFGLFFGLYLIGEIPVKGDMNEDGILNIKDLSILATVVNEQR